MSERERQLWPAVRRWGLRALITVLALLLVSISTLAFVLGHIEHPLVKGRIVAAASAAGIALDFDEAHASLRSLHISGLRIAQPKPDESAAPLVSIDRIDAQYSLWRALAGARVKIVSGEIQGVHAAIFADADGTSSITRLMAGMPAPDTKAAAKKPVPLSETLAQLSELKIAIDAFSIRDVSALLVRRDGAKEISRLQFNGLEADLSDIKGALHLLLATPADGARIVEKRGDKEEKLVADARVLFDWSARGKIPRGGLAIELKLRDQALLHLPAKAPAIGELVRVIASVVPEPAVHRTALVVSDLQLLDGAATGSLDAELADQPDGSVKPAIHAGAFDVALERFRLFVPPSIGDLAALSGSVKLSIVEVDLSKGVRIAPNGRAELHATLPHLSWRAPKQSAEVTGARVDLVARPAGDGFALALKFPLESLRASAGGQSFELSHADIVADAHVNAAYRTSGKASLSFASAHAAGAQSLEATAAELRLDLKDADLAAPAPFHIAGGVTLDVTLSHLLAAASGLAVDLGDFKLRAPLQLKAAGTGSGELHLEAAQLMVARAGRPLVAPTTTSLDLKLAQFAYDALAPAHSSVDAQTTFSLGTTTAQLHLDKHAHALDYELAVKAGSLAQVAPFVPARPNSPQIPWAKIGLELGSKGSIEHLGAGVNQTIVQESSLQLTHAALHGEFDVAADLLAATLKSSGTSRAHEVDLAMHLAGLSVQGEARPGDENLKAHAVVDLAQPKAQLHFSASGEALPEGTIDLAAAYERSAARVTYSMTGELHHLDLVGDLLPAPLLEHTDLEWSTLALSLDGSGVLDGLVTSMHELKPVLSRDPLKTVRGKQSLTLAISGLDYANDSDQALVLSSAKLALNASETDALKQLDVSIGAPQGQADAAGVEAKFEAFTAALSATLGRDSLRAQLHLGFGALKQDAVPAYPIGDAAVDLLATAGADGTLHLETIKLDNAAGGSTVTATGAVEAMLRFVDGVPQLRPITVGSSAEPRDLHFSGALVQQLASLPPRLGLTGRGVMKIPFGAESGDFHFFRVTTGLEFQDADLDFTDRKLALKKLNAKIPVKLNFRLDERGTLPLGGARSGAYSRARFVDYQPFLASEDFLSCEELRVGDSTVGPIAANLRVDRNLIALDQLEMSAFGGKLTGQLILDVDMGARQLTDVRFRGDVTGLAPGRGESRSNDVVNANAALRLNPKRLELEGRIDIVSIGRDDLSAMLDAWDPYHTEPSANRSRRALAVGYPKHVRLGFHEGFTEIVMEMGGVAGAAGIDPIHVSTGPLLEKYVEPYLKLMKPAPPPKGTP